MRWPGEDKRRRPAGDAAADGMEIARQSSRSNRRNLLLVLAIVAGVVLARQTGFFGEQRQGAPLDRIEREAFDRQFAALPLVPALDSDNGGVRVVEFFDYRCGHCRRMAPMIHDILAGGAAIELVPVELPVLGPESVLAARYALAAALQEGYGPFHRALMLSTVEYSEDALAELGAALGLDAARLREDAASPAVTEALEANRALAASVGVEGTPAFVIGDVVVAGAMDEASLLGLVAAAREP